MAGSTALRREFLSLDLHKKQGIYGHWAPRSGSKTRRRFAFADAADVRLAEKVEVVSSPAGNVGETSHRYDKLEARLRVRPKTVIVLARSRNHARVRHLAEEVATALQLELVDKT